MSTGIAGGCLFYNAKTQGRPEWRGSASLYTVCSFPAYSLFGLFGDLVPSK